MGTINQGILGGFSGKVGTVIGGTWKGISYMRGIPVSVANPQTPGQLAQRQKFSLIMGFLQPLTQFLKVGFKQFAVKMTGINAAMQYNLRFAVTGLYPDYAVDYTNALVARGSLASPLNAVAASTVPATVHFTWTDNSAEAGADAADESLLVVYNPTKHQVISALKLATRATATQDIIVPATFSGDEVQCYMSFITADGSDVATSRFAGQVTVA